MKVILAPQRISVIIQHGISGDQMKKKLTVKRKHRYQEDRDILFNGFADVIKINNGIKICYTEENKEACVHVEVEAYKDQLEIRRYAETKSRMFFSLNEKTDGVLSTPYGDISIEFYTHRYIYKEQTITLEYDIYNDDSCIGGYRIIWNIKEA